MLAIKISRNHEMIPVQRLQRQTSLFRERGKFSKIRAYAVIVLSESPFPPARNSGRHG